MVETSWLCFFFCGFKAGKYKNTSAALFHGPNERTNPEGLTLILDPNYVKEHPLNFTAVGAGFDPSNINYDRYNFGELNSILRFKYSDDVSLDEVWATCVYPEAIAGLITLAYRIKETQEIFSGIRLKKPILLFDTQNCRYGKMFW